MIHRLGKWTTVRRLTAATFLMLLVAGSRDGFAFLRGSTTATNVLDVVRLTDPLVAAEFTLATGDLRFDVLFGAGLLLAFCLVFGPVFCGWVCPLGLLLDLNDALRRVVRRKLQLPEWTLARELRFLALGSALGFALLAQLPAFSALSPIHMLSWSAIAVVGSGLTVVGVIALVEWFAPRLWCRSVCPLGAIYSIVGRYAAFRVQIDATRAGQTPCRMCTVRCPMGLRVMEDYSLAGASAVDHPDCTRCGTCVDACPSGVLRLGFLRPRPRAGESIPQAGEPRARTQNRSPVPARPTAPRSTHLVTNHTEVESS